MVNPVGRKHSEDYLAVSNKLLGLNLHEDKYAPTGLQESMLYDLDAGYYTLETRTPFSSIEWFEEENSYTHEFALEESARLYAFNKLQDYLPLEMYLNLPTVVCDDIITGLVKGRAERLKFEEERRKAEGGDKNPSQDAEALAALNERLDKLNKN